MNDIIEFLHIQHSVPLVLMPLLLWIGRCLLKYIHYYYSRWYHIPNHFCHFSNILLPARTSSRVWRNVQSMTTLENSASLRKPQRLPPEDCVEAVRYHHAKYAAAVERRFEQQWRLCAPSERSPIRRQWIVNGQKEIDSMNCLHSVHLSYENRNHLVDLGNASIRPLNHSMKN